MHTTFLKGLLAVTGVVVATSAAAQVTFYEGEGFRGTAFTVDRTLWDLDPYGFNDRASSVVVQGGSWQVCSDSRFQGRCVVLQPGNYPSLAQMGMERRISSVRAVEENVQYQAPEPPPAAAYDYRQRPGETLYQVPVNWVHAVVGPPEQRCWVDRERVVENRGGANVPGAIIGGIIGGVLGHQIGGGRGRDVATAGGAVAGAAVGANVGRGGTVAYDQDVQRCQSVPGSAQPDYWDVSYTFRGLEHRVQLSAPPGPTITVNDNGEPRG
ncbi:MAG TPA: beta/gamma crystallin-related protein [Casimicrobiaceae bacterium]